MDKVVIIPDSFKGTLSSKEVAARMEDAVEAVMPEAARVVLPIADGGEGTVAAFLTAVGGERVETVVSGPFFTPIPSFYGRLPDGTAIIEMAAAAGLPLVGERREAENTTTFGVGELMGEAIEKGAKRLILGLGGSATNDGGCGAAAALGAVFTDAEGASFVPTGATLKDIHRIETATLRRRLAGIDVTVMCDIDNPLCGEQGAAAVFSPQKGADAATVRRLDDGLAHLADVIRRDLGIAIADLPGAGAAGGMGAGAAAFFGGTIKRGIDVVLDTVDFEACARGATMVFTGEGRFDAQSLMGKAVGGVARRAKAMHLPVTVVTGAIADDVDEADIKEAGIRAVFSINQAPLPFQEAAPKSRDNLFLTMKNLLRFWQSVREQ
ncbi:MAG: glycerate kinase family protein [Schwartzia sp. (in: firmicutes)]